VLFPVYHFCRHIINNIVIDRRSTKPGEKISDVQKKIRVPIVYGQRSRLIKSFESRNENIQLPMMSFTSSGITRDTSRIHSINDFVLKMVDGHGVDPSLIQPTPINIDFILSVMTKYLEDCDQIIGNFIPWFTPTIYVVFPHPSPHLNGANLKIPITWDGTITKTELAEIGKTAPWEVVGTANFTLKSWLFAGINTEPVEPGPKIHTVNKLSGIFSIGESGFMMDNFYDVPKSMSFDEFIDNVLSGYVTADPGPEHRKNWDEIELPQGPRLTTQ